MKETYAVFSKLNGKEKQISHPVFDMKQAESFVQMMLDSRGHTINPTTTYEIRDMEPTK